MIRNVDFWSAFRCFRSIATQCMVIDTKSINNSLNNKQVKCETEQSDKKSGQLSFALFWLIRLRLNRVIRLRFPTWPFDRRLKATVNLDLKIWKRSTNQPTNQAKGKTHKQTQPNTSRDDKQTVSATDAKGRKIQTVLIQPEDDIANKKIECFGYVCFGCKIDMTMMMMSCGFRFNCVKIDRNQCERVLLRIFSSWTFRSDHER